MFERREEVGTLESGTGNSPDGTKAPYVGMVAGGNRS